MLKTQHTKKYQLKNTTLDMNYFIHLFFSYVQ